MTLIINVSLNTLAQELISAAIANSFSPQMDTNLLHHVGLASSAGGLPSLSILNQLQLTPQYAAAAAAAMARTKKQDSIVQKDEVYSKRFHHQRYPRHRQRKIFQMLL